MFLFSCVLKDLNKLDTLEMIIARMFAIYEVGLATTIISVMGLITGFSVLGLNIGLIRYLPRAKEKKFRMIIH
ncbi:hypothetical protein BMS3Abin17_01309 [archaeon BMS3Abin17]|nr:hypothetical protein BMS3Abin17_01309 [archaeon BMS3Abin17]HDZ60700.1 hypothetical protein [Candidatus Pacearchaeota archaeon]